MNHFNTSKPDEVQINRTALVALALIATVVSAGLAIRTGNVLFMAGFVALPFMIMLMYRLDVAFVFAFLLDATGLAIPGVSFTTLGLIAKMVIIAAVFLAFLMLPSQRSRGKTVEDKPLKLFIFIILMLMAIRGTGLRMLGSATWGGMMYVVLLSGIAFYYAVRKIRLSKKQIRWLLWGSLIFGIIGSFSSKYGFDAAFESRSEVTKSRITWLLPFVVAAFPLVFAVKWRRWVGAILWLALTGALAASGFRSGFVGWIVITGIFGFFRAKKKIQYIFLSGLVGCVLWGAVVASSPFLPQGIQRSISFVPGATIDVKTMRDAAGSIEWRVEIWRYCLERFKDYLLIGRGSAFDVSETAAGLGVSDIATYSPWFAYETHSYHSGPLALLIDYGIPGLVVVSWLMVLLFKRFWRYATVLGKKNSLEARFTLYWCAYMLWHIVAFYLVYGSMVNVANRILATSALIIVLFKSLEAMQEGDPPNDATLSKKLKTRPLRGGAGRYAHTESV